MKNYCIASLKEVCRHARRGLMSMKDTGGVAKQKMSCAHARNNLSMAILYLSMATDDKLATAAWVTISGNRYTFPLPTFRTYLRQTSPHSSECAMPQILSNGTKVGRQTIFTRKLWP